MKMEVIRHCNVCTHAVWNFEIHYHYVFTLWLKGASKDVWWPGSSEAVSKTAVREEINLKYPGCTIRHIARVRRNKKARLSWFKKGI